ncbi:glycosyltransferase [Latilactobacillus curvatus]|uniref:glycosyltransferase n=1 Tax=Latilactobacillus curvatus TaxID=28038 RepID=UPI001C007520|nr:glycosyltransferase [Latilactobacillus curvatus]QWF36063.1 glycosyltransferase [Latilactobacillus curvatus]
MIQKKLNANPKKVFYMVYSLTSGGIEKYSINIFKYINKNKYKLDFITKLDREEFFDRKLYEMGGLKIPLGKESRNSVLQRSFTLFRNAYTTAKSGYDLAYFNLSSPSAVFKYPLICRFAGIRKIIIHSHNSSESKFGLIGKIINFCGRLYINHIASERFACSDKAAEWMYGKKIADSKKYTFIQNGLEVDKYTYNKDTRTKIRKQLGFTDNDFILGHIGRFESQKNHQFMIEMFDILSKRDSSAKLVLIGVGSLKSKIEALVKKKGLENKVLFLGEQENVNEFLQAMDVFILPSLYEGLPVVGIEAQSAGLKCVFSDTITKESDITGNVEFVTLDNKNSWVKAIERCKGYIRTDQFKTITNAGYNIESTSKLVQEKFDLLLSR